MPFVLLMVSVLVMGIAGKATAGRKAYVLIALGAAAAALWQFR